MKFGEIDADQILENEFRIGVLENLLDLMMKKNPNVQISSEEVEAIRESVVNKMKIKYPKSGLEYKRK